MIHYASISIEINLPPPEKHLLSSIDTLRLYE